jgi:hypothetical protein
MPNPTTQAASEATMDGMTHSQAPLTSPRHAARWTPLQVFLAVLAAAFAVAITPLFFASLFVTVWDLLRSSGYGSWPWIVPLATEGCFVVLFLLDVVTVLRRKPRGRLRFAPYLFAAGSLVLNFLAGHGHPAAITGHVMVTLAFFVTVIEGEEAIRKLAVADKEARIAEMMADARRYAIDVVRDRRGRLWRWRVPALLRRDITTGRLADEVRTAVEMAVSVGRSAGWRAPVLEWVTRELHLSDEAEAADERARAAIAVTSRVDSPVAAGAVPAEPPRADVLVATPAATVKPAAPASARPNRLVPSKASDDELAEVVLPLFEGGAEVTRYKVVKAIRGAAGGKAGIGDERADRVMELARRKRVVPIGERKRA